MHSGTYNVLPTWIFLKSPGISLTKPPCGVSWSCEVAIIWPDYMQFHVGCRWKTMENTSNHQGNLTNLPITLGKCQGKLEGDDCNMLYKKDIPSLKLTASLPLKIGCLKLYSIYSITTIHFQGRKCEFQGGYVSLRKKETHLCQHVYIGRSTTWLLLGPFTRLAGTHDPSLASTSSWQTHTLKSTRPEN